MQQREEDNWRDGGRVHGAPEGEAGEITGEAAGGKTLQRLGQLLPGGGCHLLTAAAGPSSYYCIVSWQQWSRSDLHGDLLIHKTDLHVMSHEDLFSRLRPLRPVRDLRCPCPQLLVTMLVWPLVTTDHCSYTLRCSGSAAHQGAALSCAGQHTADSRKGHTFTTTMDEEQPQIKLISGLLMSNTCYILWSGDTWWEYEHTQAPVLVCWRQCCDTGHTLSRAETLSGVREFGWEHRDSGVIILDINVHLHFTYNRFRETAHQWRSLIFPIVGRSSVYHSVFSKYC